MFTCILLASTVYSFCTPVKHWLFVGSKSSKAENCKAGWLSHESTHAVGLAILTSVCVCSLKPDAPKKADSLTLEWWHVTSVHDRSVSSIHSKLKNHAGCADTIIKIEKTSCAQRPSLFTPNASPLPGLCPAPPLPHPISKGILNHVYLLKSCLSYKTKKKWTTSPHFKPTPASSSPQLLQLWLPLQFWLPLSLERSAFSFPWVSFVGLIAPVRPARDDDSSFCSPRHLVGSG